jgi:Trypsin-like peptidase domain
VLALVTNKHVVIEQENVFLRWTLQTPQGKPDYGNFIDVKFENFSQAWLPHPDPEIDLAIIPVVEMLRSLAGQGKKVFFVSLDQSIIPTENQLKELQPLEDVIIVGYPDGISDSKNNIPIFRRGITATPAYMQFEGRKQFLIDAAIYPGSSGSPVLLYNSGSWGNRSGGLQIGTRVNLLGVVFAVANHAATGEIKIIPAPTQYRQIVVSNVPNNLGVCLQSHLILDFEPEIVKRGYKPPDGYVMRSKL